jgi:hypothetical protein
LADGYVEQDGKQAYTHFTAAAAQYINATTAPATRPIDWSVLLNVKPLNESVPASVKGLGQETD